MSFDVRPERTGWRDPEISLRHREWGFDCPAVDLDFLVVEYNIGKPVALIEYKHHFARVPDTRHPTYRALADLADNYGGNGGALPFLLVFYWPEVWAFQVQPMNKVARDCFHAPVLHLTEREYVQRLYQLRGRTLSAHLKDKLNASRPQEWAPFQDSETTDDIELNLADAVF